MYSTWKMWPFLANPTTAANHSLPTPTGVVLPTTLDLTVQADGRESLVNIVSNSYYF